MAEKKNIHTITYDRKIRKTRNRLKSECDRLWKKHAGRYILEAEEMFERLGKDKAFADTKTSSPYYRLRLHELT